MLILVLLLLLDSDSDSDSATGDVCYYCCHVCCHDLCHYCLILLLMYVIAGDVVFYVVSNCPCLLVAVAGIVTGDVGFATSGAGALVVCHLFYCCCDCFLSCYCLSGCLSLLLFCSVYYSCCFADQCCYRCLLISFTADFANVAEGAGAAINIAVPSLLLLFAGSGAVVIAGAVIIAIPGVIAPVIIISFDIVVIAG